MASSKYDRKLTGEKLALLRKSRGLTQNTMADLLKVSRPAYRNYEGGTRDLPAVALLAVLDEFGVDPLALLDSSEQAFSKVSPHFQIIQDLTRDLDEHLEREEIVLSADKKWELLEFLYNDFMKYRYTLAPRYERNDARMGELIGIMVQR